MLADSPVQGRPEPIPSQLRAYANDLGPKLLTVMKAYESAWSDDYVRLEKCWKDYISYVERKASSRLANFHLPTVYVHTRIINANLAGAALSATPLVGVRPVPQVRPDQPMNFTEFERRAMVFQDIMNWLHDMSGGRLTLMHQILDGSLYGRMIGKAGWQVDPTETAEGYKPSREYFVNARISPWDFLLDPRCRHEQESEYSFEVLHATRSMLSQLVATNAADKENASALESSFSTSPSSQASQYRTYQMEHRKILNTASDGDNIDLVSCYTRLDPDKNGKLTMWQVMFDYTSGKVLSMYPAPLGDGTRPYVAGYLFPATGDMPYGMSIVEVLHALAHAKNSMFNALYDNIRLAHARPLINNNAGINEAELLHPAPGAPIHGDDISDGAIRFLQADPVYQHLAPFMGMLTGEIQEASSVSSIVQGMRAASTAFATGELANQSQQNFDIFVSYFKESFLDPMFTMLGKYCQKFLDLRVATTVRLGEEQVRAWVDRQYLQGDYIFEAQDMRVAGKKQQTAQLLMTGMSVAAQSGIQAPYERWLKLWFKYMDVPNIESLFAPENMSYPQMAGGQGGGVPGQPNPNTLAFPSPQPGSQRTQVRPGPMGEMPAQLMPPGGPQG